MFDKWTRYSYQAQKKQRYRILKYIFIFFIFFVVYNCITAFFFSIWVVENSTMQNELNKGDRIAFTSFKPPWNNKEEDPFLFKRGSIVLIDMRHNKDAKFPLKFLDGFVRFFTLQRVSIFSGEGQYHIKRVIALPGDEVSMENYEFKVKAAGSQYEFTELELTDRPYRPIIPQGSELWNDSIPFSGNMEKITLGPDECFVVSDDRSNTNDSRTWGPIPVSLISSKAILRIWPLNKINFL